MIAVVACSGPQKSRASDHSGARALAQQPAVQDPEAETKDSVLADFLDEEDGMLDVSNFLAKAHGFLPIVMPITEPATGYGAVLGLVFFHDKGKPRKGVPPTVTAVAVGGTENGTRIAAVMHQHIWKDGALRYKGGVGYSSVNLDSYGAGDSDGSGTGLNFAGTFLFQDIRHRIASSDWFVGMDYVFMGIDTTLDLGFPNLPNVRVTSRSSGLGALVAYDTRDNFFTPSKGIDALLGVRVYDEVFGSDNNYTVARGQFRTWIPMGERVTLGLRIDGELAGSDTPLFDLPFVSLRGVPAFRYVGELAITAEIEPRIQITDRWGAVVFAGAGQTAGKVSDLSGNDTVWAAGAGFRYMLARKLGLQAGFDVAYSDDDVSFYITIGSAWSR